MGIFRMRAKERARTSARQRATDWGNSNTHTTLPRKSTADRVSSIREINHEFYHSKLVFILFIVFVRTERLFGRTKWAESMAHHAGQWHLTFNANVYACAARGNRIWFLFFLFAWSQVFTMLVSTETSSFVIVYSFCARHKIIIIVIIWVQFYRIPTFERTSILWGWPLATMFGYIFVRFFFLLLFFHFSLLYSF